MHIDSGIITLALGLVAYIFLVAGWGIRMEMRHASHLQRIAELERDIGALGGTVKEHAAVQSSLKETMIEMKLDLKYIRAGMDEIRTRHGG